MDAPPPITDEGEESPQPWQDGFELFTASGGMTCTPAAAWFGRSPGTRKDIAPGMNASATTDEATPHADHLTGGGACASLAGKTSPAASPVTPTWMPRRQHPTRPPSRSWLPRQRAGAAERCDQTARRVGSPVDKSAHVSGAKT
jgi:hypothetical protein